MKCHKGPQTWADSLDKRPKLKKMDMYSGTQNGRSVYRAGSPRTVAEEISKYKLLVDLMGVQEVRWDRGATKPAGKDTFFYGERNGNHELGTGFFVHKLISAIKRVEFVSDRMSYIVLRGHWCDITVLNVHAPQQRIKLMM
jgi:hypothetical protein